MEAGGNLGTGRDLEHSLEDRLQEDKRDLDQGKVVVTEGRLAVLAGIRDVHCWGEAAVLEAEEGSLLLVDSQAGLGSQAGEDKESGLDCKRVEREGREDSQAGLGWGKREGRRVSYPEGELRD